MVNTSGVGGVVFDHYDAESYKFAAIAPETNQLVIGHRSAKTGMVYDATFDIGLTEGTDYILNVSLKGSTVSASVKSIDAINWQGIVGHAFNAVTVDGGFGLLSLGGMSSFDQVTVKTDDPFFRDDASSESGDDDDALMLSLLGEASADGEDEAVLVGAVTDKKDKK